jgi:hypothetical protein
MIACTSSTTSTTYIDVNEETTTGFSEPTCVYCERPSEETYCPACKRIIARLNREEFRAFINAHEREVSRPPAEQQHHARRIGRAPNYPTGDV